ncbi:MAG: hypothetical protein WDA24_12470 [Tissierellales bacterium]
MKRCIEGMPAGESEDAHKKEASGGLPTGFFPELQLYAMTA